MALGQKWHLTTIICDPVQQKVQNCHFNFYEFGTIEKLVQSQFKKVDTIVVLGHIWPLKIVWPPWWNKMHFDKELNWTFAK